VPNLLPVPPVSIILRQEVSEKTENGNAEETRKLAYLQRDLFAVSGSVSHEMLTVYFFDVTTQSESPSSSKYNDSLSYVHVCSIKVLVS